MDGQHMMEIAVNEIGAEVDNEEVVDYMEDTTGGGADEDDMDGEDVELPITLESCLLLNNVYIESIDELKEYLTSKLRENQSRQQELEASADFKTVRDVTINSFGYSHPNSLIPFMAPYFKDVKGLSAPPNADTIEKTRNKEFTESYVCAGKPWNVVERQRLREVLEVDALERLNKPLRDEKERLTRDKKNIVKNMSRIEELTQRIEELNAMDLKDIPMSDRWDPKVDWLRHSAELDTDHTGDDCELYWNNFLHPEVNKTEWTKAEDKRLEELVKEHGMRDWDRVAAEMANGRLAWQCCQRYQSELNRDLRRVGPLTKAEAETVEKVIDSCRVGEYIPWHQVKYFIEGRTLPQIKHYWNKINVVKRGDQWSDDENKVLTAAVRKYGTHNWRKVAQFIPGRSNRQCRERYMMRLNFGSDRKLGNWTQQEDKLIRELAPKYDFHWVKLEEHIKGRNARQIASRYELLVKYGKSTKKVAKSVKNRMTRTLTVRNQLYEKIRQMINRQNKETENLDKILRIGRQKLAKKLEMERLGISVNNKGRPKRTQVEENLDAKIVRMFASYDHKSSPKKSISRSKQDHCVYDTTKNVVKELLTGDAFDSRTELAESIRLLVHEMVTRHGIPKSETSDEVVTQTVSATDMTDELTAATTSQEVVSTSQPAVQTGHQWKGPPILPPNRTTVKGLRGLLIHSDYFSKTIAKSQIPLEKFREALDGSDEYRKLFAQFKSLFAWPALLSTIEPPERTEQSPEEPAVTLEDQPVMRGRHRKSWLKTDSSRMIEIRTNQTKLIESEMKRIAEQKATEETAPAVEEPMNETSVSSPWYVTKRDRKNYTMKSLDKSSFVFTRIRPKRETNNK